MRKIGTEPLQLLDREQEAHIETADDDVELNDMIVNISISELVDIMLYFYYKSFLLM